MKAYRLLNVMKIGVALMMAAMFLWTIYRFAGAPIYPCGAEGRTHPIEQGADGYCGKGGQPRTLSNSDYRAYQAWSRIMLFAWPIGLGALAILSYASHKTKK